MSNACRGTINLANAFIHTQDSCSFVISNSGTMTFHLKAHSEVERQRWVTALELAKSKAVTLLESGENGTLRGHITRFPKLSFLPTAELFMHLLKFVLSWTCTVQNWYYC